MHHDQPASAVIGFLLLHEHFKVSNNNKRSKVNVKIYLKDKTNTEAKTDELGNTTQMGVEDNDHKNGRGCREYNV